MPEPITRIIARARRRLQGMYLWRRVIAVVGIVATFGALLLGIARRVIMPWAEPAVIVAVIGAVLVVFAWTLIRPPSRRRIALEVDQRLGGRDQISTAVELSERERRSAIENRQISRAASWAEARSLDGFGKLLPGWRVIALSVLAVGAAIALAVPASPADAALEDRQEIEEILDAQAVILEEAAEEAATEDIAERLREAAEELREAGSLDEAERLLGDTRQE
ncbi:MAG: hypothetical protein HKN01_03100, partial [Acidimicrobiia bacterium]|nr:hypothetical protein [Acidimicrobiia bacterium]